MRYRIHLKNLCSLRFLIPHCSLVFTASRITLSSSGIGSMSSKEISSSTLLREAHRYGTCGLYNQMCFCDVYMAHMCPTLYSLMLVYQLLWIVFHSVLLVTQCWWHTLPCHSTSQHQRLRLALISPRMPDPQLLSQRTSVQKSSQIHQMQVCSWYTHIYILAMHTCIKQYSFISLSAVENLIIICLRLTLLHSNIEGTPNYLKCTLTTDMCIRCCNTDELVSVSVIAAK